MKETPWACVLGDISMVRALGIQGIPVAVATTAESDKCTGSRYCKDVIKIPGWLQDPAKTVSALTNWADNHDSPPVLFYQTDMDVVWISRFRDQLTKHYRFVLPDSELVEDLVDKARFYDRATKQNIPIPPTQIIDNDLPVKRQCADWTFFPCIVKPIIRTAIWHRTVTEGKKALHIDSKKKLETVLEKLHRDSAPLVVQAAIRGGEENVVSYHAYIRENREIAFDFTGGKIRTYPREYGSSSYLRITEDKEVLDLGRQIVKSLGFHGVVKIDLKRDAPSGKLYVLEINPRFNLWHHPGTLAGFPIPEAVYLDCVDRMCVNKPRKRREGIRWMRPRKDFQAFREYHSTNDLSVIRWLYELLTVDVNEGFQISDPGPTLKAVVQAFRKRNFLKQLSSS